VARSKRAASGALFRRSASEWREVYPYGYLAENLPLLPWLAVHFLATKGMLTAAESDMIRAVASGEASHESLTQEFAQRLAADLSD
jgi:hypothetical protein